MVAVVVGGGGVVDIAVVVVGLERRIAFVGFAVVGVAVVRRCDVGVVEAVWVVPAEVVGVAAVVVVAVAVGEVVAGRTFGGAGGGVALYSEGCMALETCIVKNYNHKSRRDENLTAISGIHLPLHGRYRSEAGNKTCKGKPCGSKICIWIYFPSFVLQRVR